MNQRAREAARARRIPVLAPPRDRRSPADRIFPPYYRYIILITFLALFFYVYRYVSATDLPAFFEVPYQDPRPPRGISIELHPKEHIIRLPTSLTHHWNITKAVRAPDGVNKTVYLINDRFPGPTLEARTGDQLVIVVSNQLGDGEGVSIHWHGLHMRDANHMDGVVGITQNPIPAGEEFTYKFEISKTQSGTFWYHSHSELQRADGLYGGLVIHKRFEGGLAESEIFSYDEDQLLMVGDWYHRSAATVQANYPKSGNEPVPDSLLLNGIGAFNCSLAVPSQPIECQDVRRPSIRLGPKTTRLRVVNVGAISGFKLTLNNGAMQVIKLDGGNNILPSESVDSVGILHVGERMDVIYRGGNATSLSIALDSENSQLTDQASTAKHTFVIDAPKKQPKQKGRVGSYSAGSRSHRKRSVDEKSSFDLSTAVSVETLEPMPQFANQTVLVYTHMEMLTHDDPTPMAYMNRTRWIPQKEPLIYLPREQWDEHQLMPPVKATGEWVDVVVNNIDDRGRPFHLHGHDFYVLTRHEFPRHAGNRTYNPYDLPALSFDTDPPLYPKPDLQNPLLKDTIYVPGRGYVILRIRADNIGLWFFHSHSIWHQGAGMAMGLDIR